MPRGENTEAPAPVDSCAPLCASACERVEVVADHPFAVLPSGVVEPLDLDALLDLVFLLAPVRRRPSIEKPLLRTRVSEVCRDGASPSPEARCELRAGVPATIAGDGTTVIEFDRGDEGDS
jgi:hypothetical protein